MLCAVLAAIAGYLLASFSGGAALNMGSEYLLMSIAVVVIGGTAVFEAALPRARRLYITEVDAAPDGEPPAD